MTHKIGLIGCGRVGVLLEEDPLRVKPASHMGGIQKLLQRTESLSVCDIDPQRLDHCRQMYDIPYAYNHHRHLLEHHRPDIVVIATWTPSHRTIALDAVKHGVKGIVLEKPVAVNLRQAKDVIDACNGAGVKLVINHERRWDPLYLKTKEIIDSGELGKLKLIYGNVLSRSIPRGSWKEVLANAGGGPLLHDGTHLTDMIRFLAGDVISVSGQVKRELPDAGAETTATAMMQTESGADVFIEAGGMRDYFNFELDLQFEKGRMKIGNGIRGYFTTQTSTRYTGFRDLAAQDFPPVPGGSDPFSGALREVMDAVEQDHSDQSDQSDQSPRSSGIDGYKAMEIVFGIYLSASRGGKPVQLPLKQMRHPLRKMFMEGKL